MQLTHMYVVVVAVAVAAGSALADESIADSWNSTGFCHDPMDAGCESCCLEPDADGGVVQLTWSGNCTGCVVQPSVACGDCFPGVQPWYNEETELPSKPADCRPCSKCTRRVVFDYIQTIDDPISDGPCKCDPDAAPKDGDCSCGAPGVGCCECTCQYQADIRAYCKLDPDPTSFLGPCAYDKAYNTSQGHAFTAACDKEGYYNLEQCGPVAPAALPPSPPQAGRQPTNASALAAAAAVAAAPVERRRQLDEHRPGEGFCWCAEPTYGIMNGTTAAHEGVRLDCKHTIQCVLLTKTNCLTRPAFCNWTYLPFDEGYECLNLREP